jgi:hypothetical protein
MYERESQTESACNEADHVVSLLFPSLSGQKLHGTEFLSIKSWDIHGAYLPDVVGP